MKSFPWLILSVPIFECTPDLYVTDHSLLECAPAIKH